MKTVKTVMIVWAVIVLALLGGWVANIVKLIGMNFDHITGMIVVRTAGIVLAPLGGVLGYF